MTEDLLPTFEAVQDALAGSGANPEPAEAHGVLCGLGCVLGAAACSSWLTQVGVGAGTDPAPAALLRALADSSLAALDAGEMAFEPLLPEDGAPLNERAGSLAEWCLGFNSGLAEGAANVAAEPVLTAGVAAEVVQDFGEIAHASFGAGEDEEEGEAAYAELVEYVRASVQLVYEELRELRARLRDSALH